MFESQNVFSFASFEKKILSHFPPFEFLSSTHRFIPVERWSRLVVAAYHRFQPVPSTWPLPPVSSFFFFLFPARSLVQKPPTIPPIVVGTGDGLTFGLMALAGSRRWWMTLGERETFGAIRRFKRFFVTGARYVAAPAWPATMRQKQCWLIAFQNCERWKTVPGHRWWRARFWERRPLFHVFFRDSKGVGEGRGFEKRSRIRGNRRAVQLNQVAAIAALDRPLEERSSIERWHTRVFVSMIRPLFSRNSFRFGEGISHCILSVEFVIYFSFFLLFFFFFHAVSGTSKMRTSLSSSFHLDGRISPWNNSIVGAENKPYYSSGSG